MIIIKSASTEQEYNYQVRIIMNNKLSKIKCVAVFLAGISAASIPATASADWSIIGLGTLGGISSAASDINNSGQVVGSYNLPSPPGTTTSRAFITGPNGIGMTDLGTLGGSWSVAFGINDSGQVTGTSNLSNPNFTHAFITGPNGIGMTDLGALDGATEGGGGVYYEYSDGHDINESGQVAGSFVGSSEYTYAFTTDLNGTNMTTLDHLDKHSVTSSYASGINDSGQVVGYFQPDISVFPYITGPNGVGTTALEIPGMDQGAARDINNSGQVTGWYTLPESTTRHAFVTGPDGVGITDLFDALGSTDSFANDINNSGQVVGAYGGHAFLFSNDVMIDLSLLPSVIEAGWTNLSAQAINDNGQIVGSGTLHGHKEAFLLSPFPVPEPETYAMLLAGLGLLGFMARRRKELAV